MSVSVLRDFCPSNCIIWLETFRNGPNFFTDALALVSVKHILSSLPPSDAPNPPYSLWTTGKKQNTLPLTSPEVDLCSMPKHDTRRHTSRYHWYGIHSVTTPEVELRALNSLARAVNARTCNRHLAGRTRLTHYLDCRNNCLINFRAGPVAGLPAATEAVAQWC